MHVLPACGRRWHPVICFTLFCLITTINSLFLQLITTNLFHPPTQNGYIAKKKRRPNKPVSIYTEDSDINGHTHKHTHVDFMVT